MPNCPHDTYPYTVKAGDTAWKIAARNRTSIPAIVSANPEIDLNRLYIGQVLCIRHEYTGRAAAPRRQSGSISPSQLALNNQLRILWEQHVFWTRLFIISTVFSLPDTQLNANRLLRNPEDFGLALRPYYGAETASEFSRLLTSHLTIAAELVNAAKAGNSAAAADAEKRWYQNADEISAFLTRINPYWSAAAWQSALYDHLAMTKKEAVDYLSKNYADSILTFDSIEKQALGMSDMMTNGIVRQFSRNF